jgi:acyl-CoA synthetase (AMP-forming)/AMP-acid ligase II
MTLDDLLLDRDGTRDQRDALIIPGRFALTYRTLRGTARSIGAALIAQGLAPGDVVAASFANGPEIVAAFFGIAGARLIFAPLNSAYTEDEFRFYLEDIAPRALVLAPGTVPAARAAAAALGVAVIDLELATGLEPGSIETRIAQVHPEHDRHAQADDVALFLHTSGTTSRPKGVPLTHGNLTASTSNIARWYELGASDVSLCVMPLFHVHGLIFSTLAVLGAGGTVVVPDRFSASAFWPTVKAYDVSVISAVPTIYRTLLLRADDDAAPRAGEHRVRFLRSSSSALPASEMLRLEGRFGAPVIEAYSMTEASHQMCANPLHGERRPGCVGVGAFVDVAILDEAGAEQPAGTVGEVAVRGPNVTHGYHNNPQANAAAFVNGWFRTGDFGVLDESGYLTLVGRLKELVNRGGEKISPVEVDDALMSHPGVADAVAFAIPDEKYGETVAAAIVLRDATTTIHEILEHARKRLASFKVPTHVTIVEAIPKTATGKVQRRNVAAALGDRVLPVDAVPSATGVRS